LKDKEESRKNVSSIIGKAPIKRQNKHLICFIVLLIAYIYSIISKAYHMAKKGHSKGFWEDNQRRIINFSLPIILFVEEGSTIIYCPPLDISGYGKSEEEAIRSWETNLDEYFKYTIAKRSLISDLQKLGWQIESRMKMTPPEMSQLLESNEDFKEIFNNREYKKLNKSVGIPVAV
jgi:hypothetical protein